MTAVLSMRSIGPKGSTGSRLPLRFAPAIRAAAPPPQKGVADAAETTVRSELSLRLRAHCSGEAVPRGRASERVVGGAPGEQPERDTLQAAARLVHNHEAVTKVPGPLLTPSAPTCHPSAPSAFHFCGPSAFHFCGPSGFISVVLGSCASCMCWHDRHSCTQAGLELAPADTRCLVRWGRFLPLACAPATAESALTAALSGRSEEEDEMSITEWW